MEAKKLTVNQVKSFEDQPAIVSNGDSKKAVLDYNDKKIELTCTLSNTKVCKWDSKYPESHNHYIIKFKFEKGSARFDFFDSLHNFETGQTDKTEMDIFEMFYSFLSDCRIVIDCYSFEDFQAEFEGTKEGYNACKRALKKLKGYFVVLGLICTTFQIICKKNIIFKSWKSGYITGVSEAKNSPPSRKQKSL